jgi:hypothetical protein
VPRVRRRSGLRALHLLSAAPRMAGQHGLPEWPERSTLPQDGCVAWQRSLFLICIDCQACLIRFSVAMQLPESAQDHALLMARAAGPK